MTFSEAIKAFFDSEAGLAAVGVLLIGIVDLVLGILAAWRDGTFQLSAVDAWLRSSFAGRIAPIWLLLIVGYLADSLDLAGIPVLLAAGIGAAGLYVAATVSSILKNWGPNREKQTVPTD